MTCVYDEDEEDGYDHKGTMFQVASPFVFTILVNVFVTLQVPNVVGNSSHSFKTIGPGETTIQEGYKTSFLTVAT